jgi:hypothetical protein
MMTTMTRWFAAKGLSTREIAEVTGWSQTTIVADLSEQNRSKGERNRSTPSTTGGRAAGRAETDRRDDADESYRRSWPAFARKAIRSRRTA